MDTEWVAASGRGRVYSYTVNHRGEGAYRNSVPFVLAYVELDEGPRIMTNIVGPTMLISPSACRSRSCSTTPERAAPCPGSGPRRPAAMPPANGGR